MTSRILISSLLVLALFSCSSEDSTVTEVVKSNEKYRQGVHYEVIDNPQKGLTAMINKNEANNARQIGKVLDKFIFSWE